jgi:aminoglycoside/choline kinase family phosphotransferase
MIDCTTRKLNLLTDGFLQATRRHELKETSREDFNTILKLLIYD